jgi:hypothetical protein
MAGSAQWDGRNAEGLRDWLCDQTGLPVTAEVARQSNGTSTLALSIGEPDTVRVRLLLGAGDWAVVFPDGSLDCATDEVVRRYLKPAMPATMVEPTPTEGEQ